MCYKCINYAIPIRLISAKYQVNQILSPELDYTKGQEVLSFFFFFFFLLSLHTIPKIASLSGQNCHNEVFSCFPGTYYSYRRFSHNQSWVFPERSKETAKWRADVPAFLEDLRMQLTSKWALVEPGFLNRWAQQKPLRNEVAKGHSWMECAQGHLPLFLNFRKREREIQ